MREVLGALEVVDHFPALGLAVLGFLPCSEDIYLKDKEELVTENGKRPIKCSGQRSQYLCCRTLGWTYGTLELSGRQSERYLLEVASQFCYQTIPQYPILYLQKK